ncbi:MULTISPECIES: ribosome maturation factor RimM [unclassified Anaeromyxobacter]|uniref:ribosome maturation factor RimM n=1 Tax=unclassified Anaeromyxobacter TaxID=2620896 RepID=UPI001F588B1A|nr:MULTISPECIES: ribosome maturation factor RimM [unclassified Anaeromyxobacter]
MALVRLGKVVRAIGLKGHLGVAGTEGALTTVTRIALRRGDEPEPPMREVVEARPQGRVWAVKVEGVSDRTSAEAWVGAEVLAHREDLPEPGEARHYWADLEGLPVVTAAGAAVGTVTGLYDTGGVDVLVVTTEDGGEKLVPLAPYVEVDVAGRRVVVDPPEGLLD